MPTSHYGDSVQQLARNYVGQMLRSMDQTIKEEKFRHEDLLNLVDPSTLGPVLQATHNYSYLGDREPLSGKNLRAAATYNSIVDNLVLFVANMDPRHRKHRRMVREVNYLLTHRAAWLTMVAAKASNEKSAKPVYLRPEQMERMLGLGSGREQEQADYIYDNGELVPNEQVNEVAKKPQQLMAQQQIRQQIKKPSLVDRMRGRTGRVVRG